MCFLKCICLDRKELLELNNLLSAPFSFMLWRSTELHSGVGGCCVRPRTRWRDYLSQLAWNHLRTLTLPEELLEDVAGAALLPRLLPPQLRAGWTAKSQIAK